VNRNASALTVPPLASAFHILVVMAMGERYGYRIAKQVELLTSGSVKLGPGTLYRQLKQMTIDGWIVECERDGEDEDRRRYYELTPRGLRVARTEAERLEALVSVARSCKLLPAIAR
jgi:DNA-binding PadR family transcriptional regulator